jgi:hypothetical protein
LSARAGHSSKPKPPVTKEKCVALFLFFDKNINFQGFLKICFVDDSGVPVFGFSGLAAQPAGSLLFIAVLFVSNSTNKVIETTQKVLLDWLAAQPAGSLLFIAVLFVSNSTNKLIRPTLQVSACSETKNGRAIRLYL